VTTADLVRFAFAVGIAYAVFRQMRKDINGIGIGMRSERGRAERRWKHMIATQIETSADLEEAKQHAKLLREDAWRD
jgi:hypothetical protein